MRMIAAFLLGAGLLTAADPHHEWTVYGGGPDSIRYSTLDQINRDNVARLAVAWTYDTGDAFPDSEMECNPIVVNGVLYATTPKLQADRAGCCHRQAALVFRSAPHPERSRLRQIPQSRSDVLGSRRGPTHLPAPPAIGFMRWTHAPARSSPTFGENGRVDLRARSRPPLRRDVHLRHHPRHRLQGPADHGQHRQRDSARLARRHSRLRCPHG